MTDDGASTAAAQRLPAADGLARASDLLTSSARWVSPRLLDLDAS
jgi:hypothetical protein